MSKVTPLRWFGRNIGNLFVSFLLALLVWISAVTSTNPNEERTFEGIPLEVVGKDSTSLVVNMLPKSVDVTLFAPRLTLERYASQPALLSAEIDLSGLEAGTHVVPVQVQYALEPARILSISPADVQVVLDQRVSQIKPIRLEITGSPARGYRAEHALVSTARVTVTGAAGDVSRVSEVHATLNIEGLAQTTVRQVTLQALDSAGNRVTGVQLDPESIQITQPITLLGGYRNVVVKVVTEGQVDDGYRLTNILVTPPNITVFSSDPQLVNDLPGYVETQPLNLNGREDDFDVRLSLDLPQGVQVVGDQSVLVRVSIAAIEGSLDLSLPVEIIGTREGLEASVSPASVDVILTGPLTVLDTLLPEELRIFIDVTDMPPGVYQLTPRVDLIPQNVRVQSILPGTLEVEIRPAELRTPTTTPVITATLTITP